MAVAAIETLTNSVTASAAIAANTPVTGLGATAVAAGRALGFSKTAGAIGERVPVVTEGTVVAISGGVIAVDALVEVGANGQVVTKASGVAVGRAMTATSGAGQQLEVLLIQN